MFSDNSKHLPIRSDNRTHGGAYVSQVKYSAGRFYPAPTASSQNAYNH